MSRRPGKKFAARKGASATPGSVKLGTRASTLATTQSGMVAEALSVHGLDVELVHVTTHGDVNNTPLSQMGGTGVFASAIRADLLAGACDLAVHSFKDLPTAQPLGLKVAAVPARENPHDALVARDGLTLSELPEGARVGTGSPRRAAQLLAARPDLQIVDIRGNVDTRVGRVRGMGGREDLDAVIVAASGLRRLGRGSVITEELGFDVMLPAPAQGALAVECRTQDSRFGALAKGLAAIDDLPTRLSATAERAVLARLEAGCAAPVGAFCELADQKLSLRAVVAAVDGSATVRSEAALEFPDPLPSGSGSRAVEALADLAGAAHQLGVQVAEDLLAQGAADIADLHASKGTPSVTRDPSGRSGPSSEPRSEEDPR